MLFLTVCAALATAAMSMAPPHKAVGRAAVNKQFGAALAATVVAPLAAGAEAAFTTTESGCQYYDTVVGTGAIPLPGQTVKVHYTGWLNAFDDLDGKFDSSYDRNRPFTFAAGTGKVIKGWDEAVLAMPIGTTRRVVIPANMGYGQRGAGGGLIPPGATLYFDIKLLGLQ